MRSSSRRRSTLQHVYKSFTAEGYRGLRHITLDDLADINIISGQNDAGKTALLEALFLHVSGPFAGHNALTIIRPLRGEQPFELGGGVATNPWVSFFEGFNVNTSITLSGVTREGDYRMVLSTPKEGASQQFPVSAFETGNLGVTSASLQIEERRGDQPPVRRIQHLSAQISTNAPLNVPQVSVNMRLEPQPGDGPFAKGVYIQGRSGPDMATVYSELRQQKIRLDLVKALRGVDDRIRGLEVLVSGGQSILHVELDDGMVLPYRSSAMGLPT